MNKAAFLVVCFALWHLSSTAILCAIVLRDTTPTGIISELISTTVNHQIAALVFVVIGLALLDVLGIAKETKP